MHTTDAGLADGQSTVTIRAIARPYRPFRDHVIAAPQASGRGRDERLRRVLNVGVAALGLIIAAPLMLLIVLLIKLTSPGPIIYKQPRVGVNRRSRAHSHHDDRRIHDHGGKLFTIYKFRTMRADSDSAPQVWARPDDPRTTPLGRVLRKYRMDELPQLLNVLKGDMNVVGPRPEQPSIFVNLRAQIDQYEERQDVLPGITGLAQISQNYDSTVDDVRRKLRFDIHYLDQRSAVEDLRIMLRTIPVLVFQRGAW